MRKLQPLGAELIEPIGATIEHPAKGIPKLLLIPQVWAGYFMDYCSREEALAWLQNKIQTLPPRGTAGACLDDWGLGTGSVPEDAG